MNKYIYIFINHAALASTRIFVKRISYAARCLRFVSKNDEIAGLRRAHMIFLVCCIQLEPKNVSDFLHPDGVWASCMLLNWYWWWLSVLNPLIGKVNGCWSEIAYCRYILKWDTHGLCDGTSCLGGWSLWLCDGLVAGVAVWWTGGAVVWW